VAGGWGSIEYGSPGIPGTILGGRWKILHYLLRRSVYRNVMGTCNRQGQCYVRNDGRSAISGTLRVSLVRFATAETINVGTRLVELQPGAGQISWFCASRMPVTAVAQVRPQNASSYPVLYGMLPTSRAGFSKRIMLGSGAGKLRPCVAACDASAACTGFTVTPTFENPTACWLYPHVHSVVYGTVDVAQTAFYHKPAWSSSNFSYFAGLVPAVRTPKPHYQPPPVVVAPHSLEHCTAVCEADENCNGFVLGGGTPLSPDGNCTFVVTPPSALISSSSHGPLVKRPSFFLKAGEPVPALPKSASPPPSPPAPPAYPRPLGPSCEDLSAIQTRSGCTNQTCMLVVEVEFSGTQTKLWNNVHRVSFAVSVSEAPRR